MVTLQVLNTYKVRKKNTEIQVSRKKVHSSYTYSLKLSYSKITIFYLKPKKKKKNKKIESNTCVAFLTTNHSGC